MIRQITTTSSLHLQMVKSRYRELRDQPKVIQ